MDYVTLVVAERQNTGLGLTDPSSVWYDDPLDYHKTDEQPPEKNLAFLFHTLLQFSIFGDNTIKRK